MASNSCGVFQAGCAPIEAKWSWISLVCNALAISDARRLVMSRGSPAGPKMPYQTAASKPGRPDSDTVGTSGMAGERSSPANAHCAVGGPPR